MAFLIAVRAVQAFGAGGMIAIGSALVKDCFEGSEMGKVLSITRALGLIAPVAAPIPGALIVKVAAWNMTFIAKTGVFFYGFMTVALKREAAVS